MHLHTLDLIVVALYFLGMTAIGFYFSRQQADQASYFLGDRRVHWFLAGISIIATLLSTVSYLAVPGEMIRYGIGFASSLLGFIIILPIMGFVIIPFLMKLKVTSIYEYIETRFGFGTRMMAAASFVLSRIIWMGLICYTAAFAITAMTGWSIPTLVILMAGITMLYTTMGGIKAVIWTDLFQFLILLAGAVITPVYVAFATRTGPAIWWETFSAAGRTVVPLYSLDPTVRLTIVGMIVSKIIWDICTHGADQVAAQRYLSTSSAGMARRSMLVSASGNIVMVLLLLTVGLSLFYFFFRQSGLPVQQFQQQIASEADKVFPRFIASNLPSGFSGLILAALLAAVMSSLSSGMNSISSVVVTDFIERLQLLGRYKGSLYLARGITVLSGLLGILVALSVNSFMRTGKWNLIELMERGNHLFVAPLGALFFVGFIFSRADGRAATGGFLAGVATSVSISFSKEIYGLEHAIGFVWNLPCAFAASFIATYMLSLLFRRQAAPAVLTGVNSV
ncbi:MAG: sodium/solute symporter [Verrucomicrobia bacterium]|nr:sodium/solute symporter [Verrucomicrobiota bacterium]